MKRRTSARLRRKNQRVTDLRRRRELEQRTTRWAASLDIAGSTAGLIPAVGVPLLRLLAQESGLRAGLSKALQRKDFHPVHDRGQVVTDVAVALAHGAANVAAATRMLADVEIVCGPAASPATAWRVFADLDAAALARLAAARATQRRRVWAALAARPQGFPWLRVASHDWDGWIVIDVDASLNVRTAIGAVPAGGWAPALTAEGDVRRGAHVTELTKILQVADGWPAEMRTMARTEPLHPKHRKQASDMEKRRGQRFQAVATDLPGHHYPKLDAFHRNHATAETVIKDAKTLGLTRLPSYYLAFNQAWCIAVAIACDLLTWLRLLTLDHHRKLIKATPDTLRDPLHTPARLVRHARERLIRLPADHRHADDLTHAWQKIRALPG